MNQFLLEKADNKTFRLVLSALMVAIGTVLSLFKFGGLWAFGGGVTFCAMLPLVVISFIFGSRWGFLTAFVFALLQMILGMKNVLYGTNAFMMIAIALLDYIIAYAVIGFSSCFSGRLQNPYAALVLGIIFTFTLRFICHLLSGWFIWEALWPNELGMTSLYYSFAYNGSYMLPEAVITSVVAVLLQRILPFVRPALSRKKETSHG